MLKRIIVTIFAFLISTAGWAGSTCPDLVGRYQCKFIGEKQTATIEIRQEFSEQNDAVVFHIMQKFSGKKVMNHKFVADGNFYTKNGGTLRTECRPSPVALGILMENDKGFKTITLYKDKNDNLNIYGLSRTVGKDGKAYYGYLEYYCQL